MSIFPVMMAGPGGLTPGGAAARDFDSGDYYHHTAGAHWVPADSKKLTFALCFKSDSGVGASAPNMFGASVNLVTSQRFKVHFDVSGHLQVTQYLTTGFQTATHRTSASFSSSTDWHHLLYSIDSTTGVETAHLYVDDAPDKVVVNAITPDEIYHLRMTGTYRRYTVGIDPPFSSQFVGQLGELYFLSGQYWDFSIEANRRMFLSKLGSVGKPIDFTTAGYPGGYTPDLYAAGCDMANVTVGTNFTNTVGTPTASADVPIQVTIV